MPVGCSVRSTRIWTPGSQVDALGDRRRESILGDEDAVVAARQVRRGVEPLAVRRDASTVLLVSVCTTSTRAVGNDGAAGVGHEPLDRAAIRLAAMSGGDTKTSDDRQRGRQKPAKCFCYTSRQHTPCGVQRPSRPHVSRGRMYTHQPQNMSIPISSKYKYIKHREMIWLVADSTWQTTARANLYYQARGHQARPVETRTNSTDADRSDCQRSVRARSTASERIRTGQDVRGVAAHREPGTARASAFGRHRSPCRVRELRASRRGGPRLRCSACSSPSWGARKSSNRSAGGWPTRSTRSHHALLWGSSLADSANVEEQASQACRQLVAKKVSGVFFAPLELTPEKDAINRRIAEVFDRSGNPHRAARPRSRAVSRAQPATTSSASTTGAPATPSPPPAEARLPPPRVRRPSAVGADGRRAHLGVSRRPWRSGVRAARVPDRSGRPVRGETRRWTTTRPDGFVCANDFTAAQLLKTLDALGDLGARRCAHGGVDDVKYASLLSVPLTTIHQPCADMGALAIGAMLDRLRSPKMPPRDILLNFHLVGEELLRPSEPLTFQTGCCYCAAPEIGQ